MKRVSIALLMLFLIAALAYAATAITVNPSEMKNGETKSLVDGRNSITIRRDHDDVNIKIEGAGTTQSLTITRSGDVIHIQRDGITIVPPSVPRDFRWRSPAGQTWFVCPKDHTMLRVPAGKDDQSYTCPVDGTVMEKRKTRVFELLFGPDDWNLESL